MYSQNFAGEILTNPNYNIICIAGTFINFCKFILINAVKVAIICSH